MKLRTMLYGLTLMLGCFVLAACVNDEEGPCLPDGETRVLFKLVLDDNAQTRADGETWGNYNPKKVGEGYDNQIDLPNVQMLLFDANGAYAGKLKDLTYSQPDPKKTVYQYIGTAPENLAAGDYKFVILANSPTVTPANLAALETVEFTYLGGTTLPNIPMWGTKGITDKTKLTVEAGTRQDIGEISLLRAVSKVTVRLSGTDTDIRNYKLEKVEVANYNTKGYVLPSGYADANVKETTDLGTEGESLHAYTSAGTVLLTPELTNDKEVTFYLPEYVNSTDAPAEVMVYLTKEITVGGETKTIKFNAPVQFCKYNADGAPATGDNAELYNITRNHYYEFNITKVTDAGALFVNPTIKDWTNVPLSYTINATTSMRLFDSWLYRYDTVDQDYTNWTNWAGSHMVVSSGRVTEATATETIIGRPLRSPQIQLLTTGLTSSVTDAFELYVDNSDFEIVRAVKNSAGAVTGYDYSGADGKLAIAGGTGVYTYFYIVPKVGVTPTKPVAHVFLYFNDPILGPQEMTYNYNALPGYSDDSSEIWAYYFSESEYDAGKTSDNKEFLKMYYKDEYNPLVPVNP